MHLQIKTSLVVLALGMKLISKFQFSGEGFSSHWVPYWRQCTPCSFQYHMIGKLETGYDDFTVSF